MNNLSRFTGKTVIVTGSSSGIGEGIARRFAAEGANVTLNARSRDDLEKVAADLDEGRTLIVDGDVSEPGFARRIVDETIDRFGGLDVLCNNAGVATTTPFAEADDAKDIDRVIDINVKGTMYLSRAAYEPLKASGGCIVNTSSVSGIGGDFAMAIYDASKGAITQLTRALALEWGRDGIRVNAVNPSLVRSEMTEGLQDQAELVEAFKRRLAIARLGEPEDVAGAVAFLASEDASWITGVNLPVDGGVSASNGQPDFRQYGD